MTIKELIYILGTYSADKGVIVKIDDNIYYNVKGVLVMNDNVALTLYGDEISVDNLL